MSQADMEKAYTEAVEQLARAVEANRLLTERLETQELDLASLRGNIAQFKRLYDGYDWSILPRPENVHAMADNHRDECARRFIHIGKQMSQLLDPEAAASHDD